jgi:telomerase reverse transcriptase
MLKNSPWPQILAIMGKEGQKIMIDLVLDCGIYIAIECGHGNYFQLSGKYSRIKHPVIIPKFEKANPWVI